MAITYNDISVLEIFYASILFKTLRKTETNIFEKLIIIDYKIKILQIWLIKVKLFL